MTDRFLLCITACAFAGAALAQREPPLPNPISYPGAPWAFSAYVVEAPESTGWVTQFKTPFAMAAGGRLEAKDHTFVVRTDMEKLDGTFDSPEKFAEHLRARRGKKSDLQRFEMIEHREEAVSSGGAVCSRYFMRTKDKGAVTGQTLTLLMAGLTCVHPAEPTLMVDAGYSERGGGEQFSDSLKSVGEKFVTSLRFLTTGAEPQYQAAKQSMKEGATDKAIAALRPLADSGDRRAAFVLAMQLAAARPAPDGYAEARRYFLEAAKDGYVDALFNLGTFYDKAQGVPRDVPQAVKWFKLAADQRDGQAQMNLAILYGRGDGVPRDLEEADRWLRMAANNGNERARQMLRRR